MKKESGVREVKQDVHASITRPKSASSWGRGAAGSGRAGVAQRAQHCHCALSLSLARLGSLATGRLDSRGDWAISS